MRRSLEERFSARDNPQRPGDAQPRLLDASPRNALRVPFLDAVFEDAMFVYVNRSPREAINESLVIWEAGAAVTYPELSDWDGPPWSFPLVPAWEELRGRELAEVVTEQWIRTGTVLLDDLEALPPERWCVTDYEAMLGDPANELQRVFKFLGSGTTRASWPRSSRLPALDPQRDRRESVRSCRRCCRAPIRSPRERAIGLHRSSGRRCRAARRSAASTPAA